MKILILVLSFNESPFSDLMEAQKKTWDSVHVEDVKTVFYYGGNKGWVSQNEFSGIGTDSYYFMHDKFLSCLHEVWNWDWDIIFRTNSSSYVNKKLLVEKAATLPTEKLYSGWKLAGHEYDTVSGAGIFLSRDIAKLLLDHIDPEFCREEDCYIGQLLTALEVPIIDDKGRYDVDCNINVVPLDRYHYRFKHGGHRIIDAQNMAILHNRIINK